MYKNTGERLNQLESHFDYLIKIIEEMAQRIKNLESKKRKPRAKKVTSNANA